MAARPLLPRPHAAMKRLMGLLIPTTLEISSGCAKPDWIDRTLVTVDVTGTWTGSVGGASAGAGDATGSLVRAGATRIDGQGVSAAPDGWIFYNFLG